MRWLLVAVSMLFLLTPAGAADLATSAYPDYRYCRLAPDSQLPDLEDRTRLRDEVSQRYDHSVEVSETARWIYSSRPVFTWATEARMACAKAIGYLDGGFVDDENIGKCDCFYQRMISYMPR